MYCGSTTLVKWGAQERTATALRCRSWSCEECRPQRRRQLIAQCHEGAPDTFLTLTSRRRNDMTADEAASKLAWCWRIIRLRIMRAQKIKKLPFIAVFEATRLGWPHLHILLRSRWINQDWLSEQMQELHDSPIVDIQRIDNRAKINAYVAKYAGGDAHKFGTAKRYWCSQDWRLQPAKKDEGPFSARCGFERESQPIARIVAAWETFGWQVTWLSKWRAKCSTAPPAGGT